eukprot:5102682-Prorocentrum_lima.AAC.1
MTSSLVGSEMCIRDRATSPLTSRRGRLCNDRKGHFAGTATATHQFGAVSYTHLTLPTICSV